MTKATVGMVLLAVLALMSGGRAASAEGGDATELWYTQMAPERDPVRLGSMVTEAVCEATATVLGREHGKSGRAELAVFDCRPLQLEAN